MKYLSHYMNELRGDLFQKNDIIIAFGRKSFDEQKKDGVKYVNLGYGIICPKKNASTFRKEYKEMRKKAIAMDIAENGIDRIILREYANVEFGLTYDTDAVMDQLEGYGVSLDKVISLRAQYLNDFEECNK